MHDASIWTWTFRTKEGQIVPLISESKTGFRLQSAYRFPYVCIIACTDKFTNFAYAGREPEFHITSRGDHHACQGVSSCTAACRPSRGCSCTCGRRWREAKAGMQDAARSGESCGGGVRRIKLWIPSNLLATVIRGLRGPDELNCAPMQCNKRWLVTRVVCPRPPTLFRDFAQRTSNIFRDKVASPSLLQAPMLHGCSHATLTLYHYSGNSESLRY